MYAVSIAANGYTNLLMTGLAREVKLADLYKVKISRKCLEPLRSAVEP